MNFKLGNVSQNLLLSKKLKQNDLDELDIKQNFKKFLRSEVSREMEFGNMTEMKVRSMNNKLYKKEENELDFYISY